MQNNIIASLIHTHTLLGGIAFWVVFLITYCVFAWFILIPLIVWYTRSWLRTLITIGAFAALYFISIVLRIILGNLDSIRFSEVGGLVLYTAFTIGIWFSRDRWKGMFDLRPVIKNFIKGKHDGT